MIEWTPAGMPCAPRAPSLNEYDAYIISARLQCCAVPYEVLMNERGKERFLWVVKPQKEPEAHEANLTKCLFHIQPTRLSASS